MTAPKAKEWTRTARQRLVASLLLRQLSLAEIVDALALQNCINPRSGKPWSRMTVLRDIRVLEEQWRDASIKDVAQQRARVLAELAEAKRKAWAKNDIRAVLLALKQERALLGLDGPTRHIVETPDLVQLVVDR